MASTTVCFSLSGFVMSQFFPTLFATVCRCHSPNGQCQREQESRQWKLNTAGTERLSMDFRHRHRRRLQRTSARSTSGRNHERIDIRRNVRICHGRVPSRQPPSRWRTPRHFTWVGCSAIPPDFGLRRPFAALPRHLHAINVHPWSNPYTPNRPSQKEFRKEFPSAFIPKAEPGRHKCTFTRVHMISARQV